MNLRALLGLSYFLAQATAYGWGDLGHQTIAEIAERHLSNQAKSFVLDILGAEPLATAAIFPDVVRPDHRFDRFIPYHYIDIPPNVKPSELTPEKRRKKDAHVILTEVPDFLRNPEKSQLQKRLLLRYLLHVVGDIHQPLHVGNSYDRGGNLCEVKWRDIRSGQIIRSDLHVIWDERIFDYVREDFYRANPARARIRRPITYPEYADQILEWMGKLPEAERKSLKGSVHTNFVKWYEEAVALHAKVYPDADKEKTAVTRTYCRIEDSNTKQEVSLNFEDSAIPTLQEDYARRALEVARLQILKAGYRLAMLLNKTASKAKTVPKKGDAHKALLDSVEILNTKGTP